MNIAWRTIAASLAAVGIAVGVACTAHADDDDDDDDDDGPRGSSSSIESWPPTKLSWPPLTVPTDDDGEVARPVVALP